MHRAAVFAAVCAAGALVAAESIWERLIDHIEDTASAKPTAKMAAVARKNDGAKDNAAPSRKTHGMHIWVMDGADAAGKNGKARGVAKKDKAAADTIVPLDGGWTKFFFGAEGTTTAYRIVAPTEGGRFVRVAITDAYCPGDAFDLSLGGKYLLSTPRVPMLKAPDCTPEDPDALSANPAYSSTHFMLPGPLDMAIGVRDSPYGGGAAFVRVDTVATGCMRGDVAVVTAPLTDRDGAAAMCARIGRAPLHVRPENVLDAVAALESCVAGATMAWTGPISLAPGAASLGCVALDATNRADPTVRVVDCDTSLPALCA